MSQNTLASSTTLDRIREEAGDMENAMKSARASALLQDSGSKKLGEKLKKVELEKALLEEKIETFEKEKMTEKELAKSKIEHLEKENERLRQEVVNFAEVISKKSGGDMKQEVDNLIVSVNEQLREKSEEVSRTVSGYFFLTGQPFKS